MKSVKKYHLKSGVKKVLIGVAIIIAMLFAYKELVAMGEERQEAINYCVQEAGLSYEYCSSRI